MIQIEYDRNMLAKVERKLGRMKSEAPKVLKNAINQTAKQAQRDLAAEAQKTYTVKVGKFSKYMPIKNATTSSLEATIKAKGKPLNLTSFKTQAPRTGAKAQILSGGSLKLLMGSKGIKAFKGMNKLIWQRTGKERYPIKPLKSNSIPKMLGNEKRVYGVVRPSIEQHLRENVEKQVRKVLEA